jgi:hypothetical protein
MEGLSTCLIELVNVAELAQVSTVLALVGGLETKMSACVVGPHKRRILKTFTYPN